MKNDISIVLSGEAGQGIQTIESMLAKLLKLSGYHVFATKEYMSRVRGGCNSTSIRVSTKRVSAFIDRIDILVSLSKERTRQINKRISRQTIILEGFGINTEALGALASFLKIDLDFLKKFVKDYFSGKGDEIAEKNVQAVLKGYGSGKIKYDLKKNPGTADEIMLSGAEAIGLGAIAGGCNFISAYPMTPSTGIFTFLSQHAKDFDIISEQAEDEISAINMVIGAWYAGARAMVTTSGGGFALMVEGVSLAGMLETPAVILLGQRPGPATGLPTRTEQADLNFALYSGHGEFPKIILTPGTIEDAFYLTAKAFNLADKYQIPVFILVDQYLNDSYYNFPKLDPSKIKIEKRIIKTDPEYKRYKITANGISPRGIPGYGAGLVVVDSDEHDEEGHITEDLDLRIRMVDKRNNKMKQILQEAMAPELIGPKNYKTLIIGWGSTCNAIKEALAEINRKDIAFLYFRQVYPIHKDTKKYLKKAKKSIIIENNFTSQFGNLIKLHTGIDIDHKILKYDGLPFSVEEIKRGIKKYG